MGSDCLLIKTTLETREAAERIARQLVEKKLAACVSRGQPVTSFYRWQGELVEEEEWPLLIKTSRSRCEEITRWLEENHPYDCPEILVQTVDSANKDYENWLKDTLP